MNDHKEGGIVHRLLSLSNCSGAVLAVRAKARCSGQAQATDHVTPKACSLIVWRHDICLASEGV